MRATARRRPLIGSVALIIACSTGALMGAIPAAAQSPVNNEPVSLTMWVTADGIQKTSTEAIFAEYQKSHPNVSLSVEEFPFLDLHDKLTVALQAGAGAPDVANVEISRFGSLLKGEIGLVDLTDRVATSGADLIPARQNNYTYKGRVYGVESCGCPVELYYRSDLFAEAGIKTPIATWDDYVAAGKLLKEKTGKLMMAIETNDYDVWTPLMLQYGGGFFDPDGNVILDSPANRKAFNWLVDLVHKEQIAAAAPGGDQYNPSFWGAYNNDEFASIWGADWMASFMKGSLPEQTGKWAVQALPTGPDAPWPTSTVGGTAMVITKQAKNVDAAWDWMSYLYLNRPPDVPVAAVTNNKKWWTEDYYGVPDPYFSDQKVGDLWLQQAQILYQPGAPYLNPDPNNPVAYDIFTRAALGPAINGDKTADQALDDAASELRSTVAK